MFPIVVAVLVALLPMLLSAAVATVLGVLPATLVIFFIVAVLRGMVRRLLD